MRMRDIQMYLSKFTNGNKGTAISDCEVFLEMEDGRLAQISNIELQESRLINSPEPARIVLKAEALKRFMSPTYKQS